MPTNPFRYTKPVGATDLIDRADEIRALLRLAGEGNNARLVAPRRYGKTSLVNRVQADLDHRKWIPVYVDLFGVVTLEDIAERIERSYTTQLTGRLGRWWTSVVRTLHPVITVGGGPLPASGRVEVSVPAASLLDRLALPRRIYDKHGMRTHIAFDEFQELVTVGHNADAILRSEIQHHGDAANYLFAGSHVGMMDALFADRRKAFYGQTAPVVLGPLAADDLGEYLSDRFGATGKTVDDDALGQLLDFVQGHPHRAMLAAHHLWDTVPDGGRAELANWDTAREQVLVALNDEYTQLWDGLSAAQRRVLLDVAHGRPPYRSEGARGAVVKNALAHLHASGVVSRVDARRPSWRLVDPVLATWLTPRPAARE